MRLAALALAALVLAPPASRADVVLDGSFGSEGPVPFGFVDGKFVNHLITEDLGKRSGENLLHSFSEFRIEQPEAPDFLGHSTAFTADGPTQNIIARVTGGGGTLVNGELISTVPGAALWLVDPSGVMLGPDAAIDVPASLHVSSAHYLRFEDDSILDLRGAGDSALSSAPIAAFGFFDQPIERVERMGSHPGGSAAAPLALSTGSTLSLVGGDVTVSGAPGGPFSLQVPSGRIQLASAASAGEIPVDVSSLDAGAAALGALGSITLRQRAFLDTSGDFASGGPAGTIWIRGGRFVMSSGSLTSDHRASSAADAPAIDIGATELIQIGLDPALDPNAAAAWAARLRAQTTGDGDGGPVRLAADRVALLRDPSGPETSVRSTSFGLGAGGRVEIRANAIGLGEGAAVLATAERGGDGGSITVQAAESLELSGGVIRACVTTACRMSSTDTSATGRGGDVTIETGSLTATNGGQISASTLATSSGGDAGTVTIAARGDVVLRGVGSDASPSGIFSRSGRPGPDAIDAVGDAGSIAVAARSLVVEDGAEISARTFGRGSAGSLDVVTKDLVRVQGSAPTDPSLLSTRGDVGDGGALRIETGTLEVLDGGQVTASTVGSGAAGDLVIRAQRIAVGGSNAANPINPTGIFSQSNATAIASAGPGGQIDLTASEEVRVFDGASVSATTRGSGRGGAVTIRAGGLSVAGGAEISARAAGRVEGAGDAGEIDLVASGTLYLSDAGRISATTEGPGQGGGVTIRAGEVRLDGGSEISARAESVLGSGDAGDISIEAAGDVHLEDGAITTEATQAFGGNVEVRATRLVDLLRSRITTTVGTGEGRGGDISIDPRFVVLNQGAIVANADLGTAGNITIVSDQLIRSTDSLIQATNRFDVQGEIRITSPDTDLIGQITVLPREFLDASALLARTCAAPGAPDASFLVRPRGWIPAPPDAPLGGFLP